VYNHVIAKGVAELVVVPGAPVVKAGPKPVLLQGGRRAIHPVLDHAAGAVDLVTGASVDPG
jgi:hypothetical protein